LSRLIFHGRPNVSAGKPKSKGKKTHEDRSILGADLKKRVNVTAHERKVRVKKGVQRFIEAES